jgi:hypothetical protein
MAAVPRQFHQQMVHYIRKTISYTNTTAVTVGKIPAGSVIVTSMSGIVVTTAFNDSGTDVIDVGYSTDSGTNNLATAVDVSALGFKPLDEAVADQLLAADYEIKAVFTGQNGNASAGAGEVVICYIPDNDL